MFHTPRDKTAVVDRDGIPCPPGELPTNHFQVVKLDQRAIFQSDGA